MKCQILFSGKNIFNLLSAEYTLREVIPFILKILLFVLRFYSPVNPLGSCHVEHSQFT